jgi:hypothetical protein
LPEIRLPFSFETVASLPPALIAALVIDPVILPGQTSDWDAVFDGVTATFHAANVASNLSVYKLL